LRAPLILPASVLNVSDFLQNLIEPFWNRMPQIFSYPFSLHPLVLITASAFVSMLLSDPAFGNVLLKGVMWLIVVKFFRIP
jgi:hypothetical protein